MNHLTTDRAKRVGDAERDLYVEHLAGTVATGHLKPAEFTERRDAALAAVTAGDLMKLIADLPAVTVPKPQLVKLNQMGTKFRPAQWGAWMLASLLLAAVPGPVLTSVFGGFGHIPLHGAGCLFLTVLGVVLFLCAAISLAPDKTAPEDNPATWR
jgi:hypothetical protein